MTGMGVKVREKVKGSGEYWIFINHDNFRRSKKIGKKATADKVANQVRARLALGDLSLIEETKTFGDYADIWWASIGSVSKKKTVKAYKVCLFKHILPVFGKKQVRKITKLDVKTFLLRKREEGQAQAWRSLAGKTRGPGIRRTRTRCGCIQRRGASLKRT